MIVEIEYYKGDIPLMGKPRGMTVLRTCLHKICAWIFGNLFHANFVEDKAKFRRLAGLSVSPSVTA